MTPGMLTGNLLDRIVNGKGKFASQVMETSIEYFDKLQAIQRGKLTVLAGPPASRKTLHCIDIALALGFKKQKILYFVSSSRRLETQLMLYSRAVKQYEGEMTKDIIEQKLYAGYTEKQLEGFLGSDTNRRKEYSNYIDVNCDITFVNTTSLDEMFIENIMEAYGMPDVIIFDSAYTLHPDLDTRLNDEIFCEWLAETPLFSSIAYIATAPLSANNVNEKEGVKRQNLEETECGTQLLEAANIIIGTNYSDILSKGYFDPDVNNIYELLTVL